jgi:hypothetical protein
MIEYHGIIIWVAYFAGKSGLHVCICDSPAPCIHLRLGRFSCAFLHTHPGFGQNEGTLLPFLLLWRSINSSSLNCSDSKCLFELQMRRWKVWENETRTLEYQYHNGNSSLTFNTRLLSYLSPHQPIDDFVN